MKYLLDTSVISELTKKKPDPKVFQWIKKNHEVDLYLSVLTLGEIQKGITKLSESKRKKICENGLKRIYLNVLKKGSWQLQWL